MRTSKHTNPQIGYERTISRNKQYRFEGFALLASVISKSAFQLLAIPAANRSASRILAQQWPNSRKAESREDKTAPNTPGRGAKRAREKRAWQGQRGSALDREGKNGRRQVTGKGEVRLGRGAKQAKEKQTWQGGRAGSKLGKRQNGQEANSAGGGKAR